MITKLEAIKSLAPNAELLIDGNGNINWINCDTKPTEEEIVQEIAKLKYEEEVNVYQTERTEAYPSYAEQFDQIFHEGVDAWKATIQAVKDAHPKQTVDETELASRKAQALFDYQLAEYTKAVARLDQYQVANGRDKVTEMQDGPNQLLDSDGVPQFDSDDTIIYDQVEVVIVTAVEPVPATVTETQFDSDMNPVEVEVENPLITKDNEERAAAQAVIDATPQAVIDEYNS